MKTFIFIALLLIVPVIAQAASLKGGYVACVSEDLFDQSTQAVVSKDDRAFQYLMKNGCVVAKAGVPVSVLDRGLFSGKVKVRAYLGDSAVILWTNVENIVE
jgi:hypothetical protein